MEKCNGVIEIVKKKDLLINYIKEKLEIILKNIVRNMLQNNLNDLRKLLKYDNCFTFDIDKHIFKPFFLNFIKKLFS